MYTGAGGHHEGRIEGCDQQGEFIWTTSHRINDRSFIGGLRSQLKPNYWHYELRQEQDSELANYLSDGIHNGFTIVDECANIIDYDCHNYKSV